VFLSHCVEGGSVLEPFDLRLVEGLGQLHLEGLAVLGVYTHGQGFADGKLSAQEVYLIEGSDFVVIGRVGECQGKHTLLLQVGFVLHIVSV
jgi:hypothetical protein